MKQEKMKLLWNIKFYNRIFPRPNERTKENKRSVEYSLIVVPLNSVILYGRVHGRLGNYFIYRYTESWCNAFTRVCGAVVSALLSQRWMWFRIHLVVDRFHNVQQDLHFNKTTPKILLFYLHIILQISYTTHWKRRELNFIVC